MSDRLSVLGRKGAEELAAIINKIFDPLLDIVFSYKGDVVKFGGDAILVVFNGKLHTPRALECAVQLIKYIEKHRQVKIDAGIFPIDIHVGISRGTALSAIIGNKSDRYDHLFCGTDISRSYLASEMAQAGEIYVSKDCIPHLPRKLIIDSSNKLYSKINIPNCRLKLISHKTPPKSGLKASRLKTLISDSLWDKLINSSDGKIEGEHRHLTTMFIGIEGLYKNLSKAGSKKTAVLKKLNAYIDKMMEIANYHGGNIVRFDLTGSGERMLAFFGAPVMRESAPYDALDASLKMILVTNEIAAKFKYPIKIKIGVNSGVSYVGDVGGSFRREYSAMGKEVNLAARLMTEADWSEIIIGPGTTAIVDAAFEMSLKDTVNLKGISRPIPLMRLERRTPKVITPPAFQNLVGRENEIKYIDSFAESLISGDGPIMQLLGDAGSGKTMLMENACSVIAKNNIPIVASACFENTANIPYAPIALILRASLNIDEDDEIFARKEKLQYALRQIDALEWECLISPLAGYSIGPSREIKNLSEAVRRNRVFQLIGALILYSFEDKPGCIAIDDLHWSDATTLEFLRLYLKWFSQNKIGVILVSRFSESVPEYENAKVIKLGALDDDTCFRFLKTIIKEELPEELLKEIVKASGGNPFYLEEIGKSIRESGVVNWSDGGGIPASVERVITARFDRLDEMVRTTIRTASVIGRIFGLEDLKTIFQQKDKILKLPSYLAKSAEMDITPLEQIKPTVEYKFKHVLTREVAYSGLSFKTRNQLHCELASYYHKIRSSRGISHGLIGYHFERSDNPTLAVPYYLLAAREAQRTYSNSESIHYYSKILNLLEKSSNVAIKCRAHLGLGSIYKLIGMYDLAEQSLLQAKLICSERNECKIEALKILSELYRIKSDYQKSSDALDELKNIDETDGRLNIIYENGMGEIARRTGNLNEAMRHYSCALSHTEYHESDLVAQLYNNLGICLWKMNRLGEAIENYDKAKNIYIKNEDLQGQAKIANNSGIVLEQIGDLANAAKNYIEAGKVFEKIGDIRSLGYCYGNLATNYIVRGLPGSARDYLVKALELFEKIDDKTSISLTVGNWADWYLLVGDRDMALSKCEDSTKLADETDNDELICENHIRKAVITMDSNKTMATELLNKTLNESKQKGWEDLGTKAALELMKIELNSLSDIGKITILPRLNQIEKEDMSPISRCRLRLLFAKLSIMSNETASAQNNILSAYKIARKSDLVYFQWIALKLYAALNGDDQKKISLRTEILEERIFEGLDQDAISAIRGGLIAKLDYYSRKSEYRKTENPQISALSS